MKLFLLGAALCVCLAYGSDAARIYAKGRAAEKAGHYDQAYVLYSEAAALDPGNNMYWLRSQAVRSRAALQAKLLPPAGSLPPLPDPLESATERDVAESRRVLPPAELKGDPTPGDYDIRGDSRTLWETVAKKLGLDCVFDSDYLPKPSIRFQVTDMDYRQALHALEAATGSFIVPLSSKLFMVATDTPQKRTQLEPFVSVAVPIPQATTPQEVTEVVHAVQQAMALDKVGLDTQRNMVILRGPMSKVVPAQVLFDDLMHHHTGVSVEVELLEVTHSDMLSWGLYLPNMFPLQTFTSLNGVMSTLASFAHGGLGGMAWGLAIGDGQLLAQMSKSVGRSLYKAQLRCADGQAATLHAGDRYPTLTSGYYGPSSSNLNSTASGTTSSTTTGTGSTVGTTDTTFGSVPNPSGIAIGDFNDDGIPDLAAAASGGNGAAILLGNGDGTFQNAVTYATGTNPAAIAVADVNKDGFLDVVTADAGSNTVSILLGNGDGTFKTSTQVAVGTSPAALAIADFNGDGNLDIAVANSGSNNISILLGNGDGTFQAPATVAAGTSPRSLIAVDLNGDNIPDLAVVNFTSNDLWILLGNGNGTFTQNATYATGNSPRAVIADTLIPNGTTDLIVANSASNTVSIFLGTGAGQFAQGVQFLTGAGPVSIAVGDFNSDGLQDLAVANYADNTVSLLLGLGTGSFETASAFPAGTGPAGIVEGDFNRDGLADLMVANFTSNDFSVLLGSGTGAFHNTSGTYLPQTGGQAYTPPPAFTFQDLGLSLKLTPRVHGMESISVDLDAEVQLLTGQALNGVPVLGLRKLLSQFELKAGEWAVVGGLMSTSEARSIAGIAGLSTLPGIGALLRQNNKQLDTDEVLMLVKPVLLSLPPDQYVTHTIAIGSETRPRTPL